MQQVNSDKNWSLCGSKIFIWKVLRDGMCNTSRAEFAPKRQFLRGKIYPVASLSFFCLASDSFLFMQKLGANRHLLKPPLDNCFPDLIWSCVFSHTRLFGCCCCFSVPLLLFLYTEVSSSFIVSHGTDRQCAEPLPSFIFILKPNSTYPYGKTPPSYFCPASEGFCWELNLTRNQPEPYCPSMKQKLNLNLYFKDLREASNPSGTWISFWGLFSFGKIGWGRHTPVS